MNRCEICGDYLRDCLCCEDCGQLLDDCECVNHDDVALGGDSDGKKIVNARR